MGPHPSRMATSWVLRQRSTGPRRCRSSVESSTTERRHILPFPDSLMSYPVRQIRHSGSLATPTETHSLMLEYSLRDLRFPRGSIFPSLGFFGSMPPMPQPEKHGRLLSPERTGLIIIMLLLNTLFQRDRWGGSLERPSP